MEISIAIRFQKIACMNFYRKAARDLQEILQEVLQEEAECAFWRFEGWKTMGKGKWRLDGGVKGYRTLWMKIGHERDGWICSKVKEATLWRNVEIRTVWGNVVKSEGFCERWAGIGCVVEGWQAGFSFKWAAHLLLKTDPSKTEKK